MIAAIHRCGSVLEHAHNDLRQDRDVVMQAVQQDGMALKFATVALKSDRELAIQAVKQNGRALQCVDQSLTQDRELVLTAVKQNGDALEWADDSLKSDREVVMTAIRSCGEAIQFVSHNLIDKALIVTAVNNESHVLMYLSWFENGSHYRKDEEVALAALRPNSNVNIRPFSSRDPLAICLDPRLFHHRAFVLRAVAVNGLALKYTIEQFQNDIEVVTTAIRQNGLALQYVGPAFQHNKAIVLEAVSQSGNALMFADAQFLNDKEVVLAAVSQDGYALRFAGIDMVYEPEVIERAVFNQPNAFTDVGEALKINVCFINQLLSKISVDPTRYGPFIQCLKKMKTVYKKLSLQSVMDFFVLDSYRLGHGDLRMDGQLLNHISGYLSLDDAPSFFKVFKHNEASRRHLEMYVDDDQLNNGAMLGS